MFLTVLGCLIIVGSTLVYITPDVPATVPLWMSLVGFAFIFIGVVIRIVERIRVTHAARRSMNGDDRRGAS